MRSRLLLLLATTAAVVLLCTAPAGAHGDEGELTLTKVEQTGPTSVLIQVGIVYEGDGHLAEDAQVSATLSGPDGATVGPVDLTRTGETTSLYEATVDVPVPGDWSVAVTSEEPAGEVSGTVAVAEQAASSTTAAAETTTTAATAEVTEQTPEAVTLQDDAGTEEDDGLSPALVVGACLVLAALVIGGAFLVARSRAAKDRDERSDTPTGSA